MPEHIDLLCIPEKIRAVFEKLSHSSFMNKYTLIGGTALSLQIKHRLSEDLDFIYDKDQLNTPTIKRNIHKLFPNYRIIKQDYNYQIDFIINETKVTFFSKGAVLINFNVAEYAFRYKKINIATIDIIAVLKLGAIAQRHTIRDYYDLYFICNYYTNLKTIIQQTKTLLPHLSPITYSETLIYTNDIEEHSISNHLNPKEIISKKDIAEYFTNELRKIKTEIK